jgi:hypothetical protein
LFGEVAAPVGQAVHDGNSSIIARLSVFRRD